MHGLVSQHLQSGGLGACSAGSKAWCGLTTCGVSQCAPVVAVQPQPGGFCAGRHRLHGVPLSSHPCRSRSCSTPRVAEQPGRCAACYTACMYDLPQCFSVSLLPISPRLCAWSFVECPPKLLGRLFPSLFFRRVLRVMSGTCTLHLYPLHCNHAVQTRPALATNACQAGSNLGPHPIVR